MDISTHAQLVLHYIDDKMNVQERFSDFIPLQSAQSIATETEKISCCHLDEQKSKLICHAYDGACVMRAAGV